MMTLGAHVSIAGGVPRALERGAALGCDALQIFLKNQVQWRGPALRPVEVRQFRAQRTVPVFAHSCYLINLAARDARPSVAALVDEIRRADQLGVPFLVLHPGAHLGDGEDVGLARIARNLDAVFRRTPRCPVRIALETTAGQGTNLGYRFAHLASIIQSSNHPSQLAVCVDTCHVFAAGYDLRSATGYRRLVAELDRVVGCNRVVAFHLNDSKTPLGSRVDRHEHIGRGHIGLAGFRHLLRDRRWRNVPMVLETPKNDHDEADARNLATLRALQPSTINH